MSFYSPSLSLGLLSRLRSVSFHCIWDAFFRYFLKHVFCFLPPSRTPVTHVFSWTQVPPIDTLFISSSLFCFILESSLIFSSAKSSMLSLLSSVFSVSHWFIHLFDLDHFLQSMLCFCITWNMWNITASISLCNNCIICVILEHSYQLTFLSLMGCIFLLLCMLRNFYCIPDIVNLPY